jgi:hypothetical protein
MKKYISGIIGLIFILSSILGAQPKSKPYDYPIKPGTPEWKALTTTKQKIDACQIPESILSNMSTYDLLETCLNYPFNIDLLSYNQIQDGFNAIRENFNGWRELLQREDLGTQVLKKYSTMIPDSMINQQYPGHDFLVMETLLKQDEVISTLPKEDRIKLLKESYEKYTGKLNHPEKFALFGVISNISLMGKILTVENYDPFVQSMKNNKKTKSKIKMGSPFTKEESDEILKYVEHFLKE